MDLAYSFLRDNDTYIIHISKGNFTIVAECTSTMYSLCKEASTNHSEWITPNFCLTEQQAREVAAKLGREVCPDCISLLYGWEKKAT
jgi:uncharacterized protein YjiK